MKIDVMKPADLVIVGIGNDPHAGEGKKERDAGEEQTTLRPVGNALDEDPTHMGMTEN